MATNINMALCLAEAFGRHGVAVTFDQNLFGAVHLAVTAIGIKPAGCREKITGGAMVAGCARISGRALVLTASNGEPF